MILRNFVVFEGIDGAGTSTQIQILKESADSDSFVFTAEPTDSSTGKFLREVLKGDVELDPRTSAFLFAADRAEHLWGKSSETCGIEEKCKKGKIVVSDRYLFSSLAYQSVSCGDELPRLLNSVFPLPQILFFFEIEPEQSLKRIGGRETVEIYENAVFLQKTEKIYKAVIEEFEAQNTGMKIVRINAAKTKDEISSQIREVLAKEFNTAEFQVIRK